jgi:alpha-glucosidase (family GH31 glycosyl hydrolase)
MRKIIITCYLLFFIANFINVKAQNPERKFIDAVWKQGKLQIQTSDATIFLEPFHPKIIKINYVPKGQNYDNLPKDDLREYDQNSNFKFKENKTELVLKNKNLTVLIKKQPFQITYLYNQKNIADENLGYLAKNQKHYLNFYLKDKETIYGTGSRAMNFDRRGTKLEFYNKAHDAYEDNAPLMYFNIPVILSSQNYGIFFKIIIKFSDDIYFFLHLSLIVW